MQREKSPYEVLKLSKDAQRGEIKKTYFELVKQYTPERDAEKFKEIRAAYEKLRDPKTRIRTDVFHFNDPFGEFRFNEKEDDYDLGVYPDDLLAAMEESRLKL
ncbi:MAG: DnaJ domain-containing protein [bacterium]|nr:DnaJ domain-containing protein [bacterium]